MAEDRFVVMKCPKCGKVHPNTWANLEAYWESAFPCEKCGLDMKIDREQALAARDGAGDDGEITIEMVAADEAG